LKPIMSPTPPCATLILEAASTSSARAMVGGATLTIVVSSIMMSVARSGAARTGRRWAPSRPSSPGCMLNRLVIRAGA
jgi:hypothetical protein